MCQIQVLTKIFTVHTYKFTNPRNTTFVLTFGSIGCWNTREKSMPEKESTEKYAHLLQIWTILEFTWAQLDVRRTIQPKPCLSNFSGCFSRFFLFLRCLRRCRRRQKSQVTNNIFDEHHWNRKRRFRTKYATKDKRKALTQRAKEEGGGNEATEQNRIRVKMCYGNTWGGRKCCMVPFHNGFHFKSRVAEQSHST